MGVKNLWDILESCKKTLPLHYLQNKRVCIDLSCWMVQLHNVNKSHCSIKDKLYLQGLFHRLRALLALNCSLIFVADGSIPALKLSTYKRRLNQGSEFTHDDTNSQRLSSKQRNAGSEFSRMIREAEVLGMALGIPCLHGVEEAEAQCALLNSQSLCDGCFTSDSDAFLFGARTVYRDICLGEGGYIICYEMDDIERKLGFGRNSLIALAIILGSDYYHGIHGLGRESACQIVKSVGDAAILQRIASEGLSFAKRRSSSKKNGQLIQCTNAKNFADQQKNPNSDECNLQSDNHVLQVINAYLKPKCHSADSSAVHRVLAQYPFNHGQLLQIGAQLFDWPPEKTDEYILPKIAERELRRFANLRSTSLALGVQLSLDEMPVKCHLSSIIKQRRLQGRDYFEVSWEEVHGLKASLVPADLVESACPEKISEFHERRDKEKKRNCRRARPKKVEKGTSIEEVEQKLQQLLLDLDQKSNAPNIGPFSGVSVAEKTDAVMQVCPTNPECDLPKNLKSAARESSADHRSMASCVSGNEVIDLMSPSPSMYSRSVSKIQENDVQCISLSPSPLFCSRGVSKLQDDNVQFIDVIELSDSENDMSPEHIRKARELRLFIASIRDDNS